MSMTSLEWTPSFCAASLTPTFAARPLAWCSGEGQGRLMERRALLHSEGDVGGQLTCPGRTDRSLGFPAA